MKLEINTNGAWRTVLQGLSPDNAEQYRQAVMAAATLASIDAQTHPRGKPQSWRLMCEQTGRVKSYCLGAQGWTERAA